MKYFTISELIKSDTALQRRIWNGAPKVAEDNLSSLVGAVLDPLREKWGKNITVSSGYRCRTVNKLVGGTEKSQHLTGEAVDITAGSPAENLRLAKMLVGLPNGFDQLVLENTGKDDMKPQWLHVSWKRVGDNRHAILRKVKGGSYEPVRREELL